MAGANVVNLDALIKRADLAAPGELGEDISAMSIMGLEPRGLLYPALRKPDFQRETANWSPDQVADLIGTFAKRDLIPAVILWRAGQNVFVIDGAHRISALIAWVHNDYGDGEVSRRFFQNVIPDEQLRAADRTRDLVKTAIGSYEDHKIAIDYPQNSRPDVVERAARIGWQEIPAQWIRNADHEKAEKAFFRINQGGTKIDPVEKRILSARRSATALAARSIMRAGKGHNYWRQFEPDLRDKIESLGAEINELLFKPGLMLPIKTLDVPVAGPGYGPRVLPFVFDLVNVTNHVQVKDSSHKRAVEDTDLTPDETGDTTVRYLQNVRRIILRICSNDPSSLGLHPALYFYARSGTFQASALLSYIMLFSDWETKDYLRFVSIRNKFEDFISRQSGVTEAVRRLGSGARSRPRITALYRKIIAEFLEGKLADEISATLSRDAAFDFFSFESSEISLFGADDGSFSRDIKGATYIKDALPTAPKCPTCSGLMHVNGMQVGHIKARRNGGLGDIDNGFMQHPFCNMIALSWFVAETTYSHWFHYCFT